MAYEQEKKKERLYTLRFSILFIFISLIIVITLSIIALRSWVFAKELTYTSFEIMHHAANAIEHQLNASVRPAQLQSQLTAKLIEQNVVSDDPKEMAPFTYLVASRMPLSQRVFWANEVGDYIYSLKEADGSIITEIINRSHAPVTRTILYRNKEGAIIREKSLPMLEYDPRQTTWYQAVKKNKQFEWSNVQVFLPNPRVGIGAMSPVFNSSGEVKGIFGINISLNNLSQFLGSLKVSEHGYAFMITPKGELVAYPNIPPFNQFKVTPGKLVNIHEVALPLINQSFSLYQKTKQTRLSLKDKSGTYLITYVPVTDLAMNGWLIGVVTPRNDIIGTLRQMNFLTLGISFALLVIGILLVSRLVSRIVRPIHLLANETEKIKHFDLTGDVQIHSKIKEVIELSNAIRAMKKGLRSFQKYVPRILVERLVSVGEDALVGGVKKPLVVFFSDIENFTSISESMDPTQLTLQLCDYFEALTQIIIEENGTIDKYIGDAIMAFWGAPLPTENAAILAARAAVRCQTKIKELNAKWKKQGKPIFNTRMGIHSGDAIVGNIGSSERLNYTALGDTVNTASRLEKVNKHYQTLLMVSETIRDQIKDHFHLRLVDSVTVKGKHQPALIYELVAAIGDELSFDIAAFNHRFEQGFIAYQHKRWKEALDYFELCLKIFPEDTVVPLFIARCKEKQENE